MDEEDYIPNTQQALCLACDMEEEHALVCETIPDTQGEEGLICDMEVDYIPNTQEAISIACEYLENEQGAVSAQCEEGLICDIVSEQIQDTQGELSLVCYKEDENGVGAAVK